MSNGPRRRLLDQFGASPTFVAEGTRLVGNLETRGALIVCGHVQGNGRVGGALSLARGSTWTGDIAARLHMTMAMAKPLRSPTRSVNHPAAQIPIP
jgi:hypothetical protein